MKREVKTDFLLMELREARAEAAHWQRMAEHFRAKVDEENNGCEMCALYRRIKELGEQNAKLQGDLSFFKAVFTVDDPARGKYAWDELPTG